MASAAPSSPGGSSAAGSSACSPRILQSDIGPYASAEDYRRIRDNSPSPRSSAGGSAAGSFAGSTVGSLVGSAVGSVATSVAGSVVSTASAFDAVVPQSDWPPLFHAVCSRNVPEVNELFVQDRAKVSDTLADGTTALHIAIQLKDFEMCKVLIHAGADPSQRDNSGKTPVDIAKKNKLRKILQNMEMWKKEYQQYILSSLERDFLPISEALLDDRVCPQSFASMASEFFEFSGSKAGSPTDYRGKSNAHGQNIFHVAAGEAREAVMKKVNMLLQANAGHLLMLKMQDDKRQTPFCLAANAGNAEFCDLLKRFRNDRYEDIFPHADLGPLGMAAKSGHLGICNMILQMKDFSGFAQVFLHSALAHVAGSEAEDSLNVMNRLLVQKANPNYIDVASSSKTNHSKGGFAEGSLALHHAAGRGSPDAVRLLLENKAMVNLACKPGETALMLALRNQRLMNMQVLLEAPGLVISKPKVLLYDITTRFKGHADANYLKSLVQGCRFTSELNWGGTVLHKYASDAISSSETIVKSIEEAVSKGIDPNLTNEKGMTALFIAVCREADESVMESLLKHRCDPNVGCDPGSLRTVLMEAVRRGSTSKTKRLLEAGASVDAVDITDGSVMLHALRAGKLDAEGVQALIDAKASLAHPHQNCFIEHPSVLLACCKRVDVAETLLKNGVDVNAVDSHGQNALFFNMPAPVYEVIIKAGCNLNQKDLRRQCAPLHHMVRRLSPEQVRLLLDAKADHMQQDRNGQLPLFFACSSEQNVTWAGQCILMLYDVGPIAGQFDHVDNWRCTPLCWATSRGTITQMHILVELTEGKTMPPACRKRPIDYLKGNSETVCKKRKLLEAYDEACSDAKPKYNLSAKVMNRDGTMKEADEAQWAQLFDLFGKIGKGSNSTGSASASPAPTPGTTLGNAGGTGAQQERREERREQGNMPSSNNDDEAMSGHSSAAQA